jgi:hypothetical protein
MNLQESGQEAMQFPDSGGNRRAEVLSQLAQIQNSHAFCNSARSKEFLSYVVEQALADHTENLKERSIGVNLFHRAPSYDTGDDPIVRVKAGEVRRRLAEYYAAEKQAPELQIELPVGSYIPKFHWRTEPPAPTPVAALTPWELEDCGICSGCCDCRNCRNDRHPCVFPPSFSLGSILGTAFRNAAACADLRTIPGDLCCELRSLSKIACGTYRDLRFHHEAQRDTAPVGL